ncbi:MAG: carboxylating nicotinate-nucleotide diphosphorylase [Planctomycetota bacterium]|jgi:nicotinate-nucleotide pyrophosphorylase (carboxylating)|nr:carboxylating nicotinate-nucleotide diphosphorylase [Planctomycetota bacterium]
MNPDSPIPGLTAAETALADRLLDLALDEDLGSGDATTLALFAESGTASGGYVAREAGVMAGGDVVARLFALLGRRFFGSADKVRVDKTLADGERFAPGDELLAVEGEAGAILSGERASLNLLQRMCAVAARTRRYVDSVAGAGAAILDTRKTTPGLRVLDKLSVRAGGGVNHRMGLYDMILIKDNHLAARGGAGMAVRTARERSGLEIMVEVDTLEQLRDALPAEPDYVLLDNMGPDLLREAVAITAETVRREGLRRPLLEASGGVRLETVRAIAESGVDRVSVGALTHGAGSVDIGLDFY